jgi:predicted ATPase
VTGAALLRPWYLAFLSDACWKSEQTEEGLSAVAEALAAVEKNGERYNEPELYRLKGELLLAQESRSQKAKGKRQKLKITNPQSLTPNPRAEAEACFHKAIEIARQQSAKSLELRAVMSLSQLWQQQGKKTEARQMLAEIYDWFTEGFDTKDLQEAKALLQELTTS